MCLQMPQGYFAAGDAYTPHYNEIIECVKQKVKIIDDTLLYDESIEQHFYHVCDYLTLCAKNGIIIHARKFQFCKDTVDFAVLIVTVDGVVPPGKMLSATADFRWSTDLTSARAWFVLVNQVLWTYAVSPIMQPFHDLIKPNRQFCWDDNLEVLFESSKDMIINPSKTALNLTVLHVRHAFSQIGAKKVLAASSCRNTVNAPKNHQSAVRTVRS